MTVNCAHRADTVFYVPAEASFTMRSGKILNAGRYGGELTVSGAGIKTNSYDLFVRDGKATVSDSRLLRTDGRPCEFIGGTEHKNASVTLNRVTMTGGSSGTYTYVAFCRDTGTGVVALCNSKRTVDSIGKNILAAIRPK